MPDMKGRVHTNMEQNRREQNRREEKRIDDHLR